jgi:hypothetical protein
MQAAPMRFMNAALWPLSVWTSFAHLEEHPADDYVERTSPIVATAIGFWICALFYATIWWMNHDGGLATVHTDAGAQVVHLFNAHRQDAEGVLALFLPLIYIVGLWMFTARAEKFRN